MKGEGPRRAAWSGLVAYSVVFAALVYAATLVSIATPVTKGYFNLGESMVYTAAVLGGPAVGAIAGAVGSAAADLTLGYAHYAPGTFVIKGLEGYIVGWLFGRFRRMPPERLRRMLPWMAALIGGLLAVVSAALYNGLYGGEVDLEVLGRTVSFTVPPLAWIVLAVAIAGLILWLGRGDPLLGAAVASMLVGGIEMVLGYFLYEATVIYSLGVAEEMSSPLAAAAEIPVNIGQAVVGASIAVVVVGAVWRARGSR